MTTRTLFAGKESAWEGWDPLHQAGHVTLKDHKIDRKKRPKCGYVSKHTVVRYRYAPNTFWETSALGYFSGDLRAAERLWFCWLAGTYRTTSV